MGLVWDVIWRGLCVRVKAKAYNSSMVELMCWWLGVAMMLFILGRRENEREANMAVC